MTRVGTFETETNFPYTKVDSYKQDKSVKPKLDRSNYYLGYKDISGERVVRIFDSTISNHDSGSFQKEHIKIIKSLLSSGIPIAAAMHGASNNLALNPGVTYTHEDCQGASTIDHQVVIVGYGKKDKTDVWVVRNSWGPKWGAKGYFYVPIGSNSYCLELYAYAVIPEDFTGKNLESVGDRKRGIFRWQDLDSDKAELVDNDGEFSGPLSKNGLIIRIVIVVVIFIVLLVLLIVLIKCCCCKCCCKRKSKDADAGYKYTQSQVMYGNNASTLAPVW